MQDLVFAITRLTSLVSPCPATAAKMADVPVDRPFKPTRWTLHFRMIQTFQYRECNKHVISIWRAFKIFATIVTAEAPVPGALRKPHAAVVPMWLNNTATSAPDTL